MRQILLLCFLFASIKLFTQTKTFETKFINKDSNYYELINFSNSSESLKLGLYQKYIGKDLAISGQYFNNDKVGLWKYYDWGGKENLIYDYTNNQVVSFKSDTLKRKFIVNKDTLIDFLDRPVLYFGSKMEIGNFVHLNLKIPRYNIDNGIGFRVFVVLEINESGEVDDLKTYGSHEQNLIDEALRVVKGFKGKWIPAIYKGQKVKSFYLIPVAYYLN